MDIFQHRQSSKPWKKPPSVRIEPVASAPSIIHREMSRGAFHARPCLPRTDVPRRLPPLCNSFHFWVSSELQIRMDPPPANLAASKRRDRKRRRRRAAAAAATEAGSEVLAAELEGTAQGQESAAAAASSSRRREPRPRLRRDRVAKAKAEALKSSSRAPVSATVRGKTDGQGYLHDTTSCVSDVVSIQGASSLQSGCCSEAVEARSSVSLPQTTTKKSRRRNLKATNKTTNVSPEDGSASYSLSCENSVGEIKDLSSKFFKQSDVTCRRDNCTVLGNANTNMDYQNEDPNCPVTRETILSGNSKGPSPDCRSLQELEEHLENENGASIESSNLEEKKKIKKRNRRNRRKRCKKTTSQELEEHKENANAASINSSNLEEMKKRKKRKRRNRRNRCKKTTSQNRPLSNGTEEYGFVVSVSEKNASCHRPVTSSAYVDDAKSKEGESVNLDDTIAKRCELGRSNTITEINKLQKQDVACSEDNNANFLSTSSLAEAYVEKLKVAVSPRRYFIGFPKKKLIILDLNGLLADINQDFHNAHMADAKVRGKLVFRRPYCDDFLKFCSWNFDIGIWSSRKRENVASVINIVMSDFKPRLLFCWDMSKCTFTGCKTLENKHKPLMLKELRKLWNKEDPDLPWEDGDYLPSNTLLVDDSPYKALLNPPHTAIFPRPYSYLNQNDNSLGPGGDLRVYLQNLAVANDVESYVRNNPFGQPFITESDPSWNFYAQIVDKRNTIADKEVAPLLCLNYPCGGGGGQQYYIGPG